MADNTAIELRYYPQADPDRLVFSRIWQLVQAGTTTPVDFEIAEAYLDIIVDGRAKGSFTLGDGMTWNSTDKSMLIQLTNSDVSFIRDTTDMEYSFYVTWDYGAVQTIREGTVSAVRVA